VVIGMSQLLGSEAPSSISCARSQRRWHGVGIACVLPG
jgi:hypothetical protein